MFTPRVLDPKTKKPVGGVSPTTSSSPALAIECDFLGYAFFNLFALRTSHTAHRTTRSPIPQGAFAVVLIFLTPDFVHDYFVVGRNMAVKPIPSFHVVTSWDFYPGTDRDHSVFARCTGDGPLACLLWVVDSFD